MRGTVEVNPVVLEMNVDDHLLARITRRVKTLPTLGHSGFHQRYRGSSALSQRPLERGACAPT